MAINTMSGFDRTRSNLQKMGAYYTDVSHCKWLSNFFAFSSSEETCCLEPSIGDGKAIIATTGVKENPNVKIFGVELNDAVAEETKKSPFIEDLIKGDFLNGVRISNNTFSFMFGNPPYINDDVEGEGRMELTFLQKAYNYLTRSAIVVWVIPHREFIKDKFLRFWLTRFETLHVFKFHNEEFQKFNQVALIGRKSSIKAFNVELVENAKMRYGHVEDIEEVPVNWDGAKIEVPTSCSEKIKIFAPMIFPADEALQRLLDFGSELDKSFDSKVKIPEYVSSDIGMPPIPPKNDSMYLLSVCGVGAGLTGMEGVDLHLQRGVAESVETTTTEEDERGDLIEKKTIRTQIKMAILQPNGEISHLM